LRASAGVIQALSPAFSLDFTVQAALSSRPDFAPSDPLIPIEPRVLGLIGLRYQLVPAERPAEGAPKQQPTTPQQRDKPVEPAKPTTVLLELRLIDDDGQPVIDANVELEVDGKTYPLQGDDDGNYRIDAAPIGDGKLRASGEGIKPVERDVTLGSEPVKVEVMAPVALPTAQVRGLVRSFQGKPVKAKIRVEPSGQEITTDDKGAFVVDVEPGEYEVVIEAAGYETQRRNVKVAKQGVVVLNADLVKKR
jgi:hypothetical protein